MKQTRNGGRKGTDVTESSGCDFSFGNPETIGGLDKEQQANERNGIETRGDEVGILSDGHAGRKDFALQKTEQLGFDSPLFSHAGRGQRSGGFCRSPLCVGANPLR